MSDMNEAPLPAEVWVVCCQQQEGKMAADFVANYRQGAMEHAAECAGGDITAEYGPYRVARYVLADAPRPEAQAHKGWGIRHTDGRWRTMDTIGMPDWTDDPAKALVCRLREHVDAYAADDPEDVRIVEVEWAHG